MAKKNRDPRRDKILDMRRLGWGRLSSIFLKCHPEHDWKNLPKGLTFEERLLLCRESDLAEEEWMRRATGGGDPRNRWALGAPPAWFRRHLNRLRRSRDKQAMREQLRDGVDDVTLPRRRRDVGWLWW